MFLLPSHCYLEYFQNIFWNILCVHNVCTPVWASRRVDSYLTNSGQFYMLMGITVINQSYPLLNSIEISSMHTAQCKTHMLHVVLL